MIRASALLLAATVLVGGIAQGETLPALDWTAWQTMPVLHDGRIKPLDTYARSVVRAVTGSENPRLRLPDEARGNSSANWAEARKLFPDGEPRQFTAEEILFSWIVEPEKWQRVPFLSAGNETLRTEVLELPTRDAAGNHLKFVSPHEVAASAGFRAKLNEIGENQRQARQAGKPLELSGVDRKVSELYDAYELYEMIAFNPLGAGGVQGRFLDQFVAALKTWNGVHQNLQFFPLAKASPDEPDYAAKVQESVATLQGLFGDGSRTSLDLKKVEPPLWALHENAAGLSKKLEGLREHYQNLPAGQGPPQREQVLKMLRATASQTADISRLAHEAHLGLYDTGRSLAIVPALNPAALEKTRAPEDQAQPWLSLQTVIFGSDVLLAEYPTQELNAVRVAFRDTAIAYLDRENPQRPERFAAAMKRFTGVVRTLGEAIEPLRQQLPIQHRDEDLIAATAYPPPGSTRLEVFYNHLDPFTWTWVLSLGAVIFFLLGFWARRMMFWTGMALMIAGQLFTLAGLGMRVYITGRPPVTNMFETIIFVAMVVAMLGLWFTFVPLVSRGGRLAWRLTAIPGTFEAGPWEELQVDPDHESRWSLVNLVILIPRALLALGVFAGLALVRYGVGDGYTAVSLLPRTAIDASLPNASDWTVWAVGLAMLGFAVWFVPRVVLTAILSLGLVPYSLVKFGAGKPVEQVVARKPFVVAGGAVALLAAYVACNAPVFDKNINPLMPVLRDNFWLTAHVLTITASYGAGALAWGLANIALGYYLFGRYRAPEDHVTALASRQEHRPAGDYQASAATLARRPPESCSVLSTYVYKAAQVAVVLLAAGTILGALWADVSWGRFWGWDSKEVWALISLLVYLAVLHGRYAGMFGNFGLAVGAVFAATSILLAWYGVNYIFGTGLHTYGTGTGGQHYVFIALALNWLFVAAASARYLFETQGSAPGTKIEPQISGDARG